MGTRCQVKVKEHGVICPQEEVTLYHHFDGYPSNMVPLIAKAYEADWKHGRVGKVATFLVTQDAEGYEIEQGHELHGDIEWYYILDVKSEQHIGAIPEWFLRVYKTPFNCYSIHDMKLVFSGPIEDAEKNIEAMEEMQAWEPDAKEQF